jgi:hypothetical protein
MIECSCLYIYPLLYIDQGSHYFQIRGRSDVSFREQGEDNREKWGDLWEKLMAIN